MKIFILKFLADLEYKRNCFIWQMFNHFFWQDYDDIDLENRYYKYSNKLKVLNEETPERKEELLQEYKHQQEILRIKQEEIYLLRPVELSSKDADSIDFLVLNLDTGNTMNGVTYANQSSGDYIQKREVSNGRWLKFTNNCNLALVWKGDNEKR